ncbi:nicotinate-nucleotide adenylyltransferase [Litoreibacter roseus]|nr:nicotinate-nucleotide adenylyltransferase [Litoreibacter roseus]
MNGLRAWDGLTVGLLGGSFDPAHEGHAHITREALKRFSLDAVWWLVSPGNPLKQRGPASFEKRLAVARQVMQHPRVTVTDIEYQLGTVFTSQTLRALRERMPQTRLVWLMGADNLANFHQWQGWHDIIETVPMGVLARPGDRLSARRSLTAQRYAHARLPGIASHMLARQNAPAWCYINLPLSERSSSAIRAAGQWDADT